MRWRPVRIAAIMVPLVTLFAAAQIMITQPARSDTTDPVRIMALGDSITGSPGCWRALLWQELQENGYTNIDMVGTQAAQGCGFTYDGENEGHGGALVTTVASQNQLPDWLAASLPDVVLMHFGTNDAWSNIPTETILAAYSTLVAQMRDSNPTMSILVAQIIPLNPSTCTECADRVIDLNAAIPDWAASETTSASPIAVVDQWTGFDTDTDTYDGVHPNDSGNVKMADAWYPALAQVLDGSSAASPTASVSASASASDSPSASASASESASATSSATASSSATSGNSGCGATYQITNQWSTGFQGGITVTNTGDSAISTWTVTFSFAEDQSITQSWSAVVTQSESTVTVTNASWNGALANGASVSAGFIATWNGTTNSVPAMTCAAA